VFILQVLGDLFLAGKTDVDLGAWIHWLGESKFINAIIEKNGILLIAVDEESSSGADDEVSMRNLFVEHRPFKIGRFYVCVEMISTQISEAVDVFRSYETLSSYYLIADV